MKSLWNNIVFLYIFTVCAFLLGCVGLEFLPEGMTNGEFLDQHPGTFITWHIIVILSLVSIVRAAILTCRKNQF